MDSVEIPYGAECRPLAGRIVLEIEELPEKDGSIIIPEISRIQREQCQIATVISVGYGPYTVEEEQPDGRKKMKRYEGIETASELKPGDRVFYRPLLMEIGQKRIVTDVRRVDGVIG